MPQSIPKDKLIEQAVKVIKEEEIVFISEVWPYLDISKQTFYNKDLDKVDEIKEAVQLNKLKMKKSMKKKWHKSDNATMQIALMRLVGTSEERQKLSQQHVDHTSAGDKLEQTVIYMPQPNEDNS